MSSKVEYPMDDHARDATLPRQRKATGRISLQDTFGLAGAFPEGHPDKTANPSRHPSESKSADGAVPHDASNMALKKGEHKDQASDIVLSFAAKLTTLKPMYVSHVVLKFTTLSDGNEKASFVVPREGGDIGRSLDNAVCVPSDKTLARMGHASVEWRNGQFQLLDNSKDCYHAAVRVGVGKAAGRWPLSKGVLFSAGNSIFQVEEVVVSSKGSDGPYVKVLLRTGPSKGKTLVVNQTGATLGRANDNTVCIPDRELSRRHSQILFDEKDGNGGGFYVRDLNSTNGTYVQLVGPFAGRYPLNLNDHILVGRTGFSVNRYDFGISEEMGMRRTMEDKCILVQDLHVPGLVDMPDLSPQTWAGVYDGHGGHEAAHYLHQHLHAKVVEALSRAAPQLSKAVSSDDVVSANAAARRALNSAFLSTDKDFLASHANSHAGSTATSVLVLGNRAYCANVGDSRTVLCRNGKAVPLSSDHKPTRDDESLRIRSAGGYIISNRVMGELAVSRAFGDAELKKCIVDILGEEIPATKDESIEQDFSKPLVIAEPEIEVFEIGPQDEFLLLACDGLFDVLGNQEACNVVRAELEKHGDIQRAAESLTHMAIEELHSRDNVTVMIVQLSAR